MEKKILLEQEHQATKAKIFLASMDHNQLEHLIKLARDPSLMDLLGWNTFFELDEKEEFIEAISSYALPYSQKSQPLVLGIYLDPEELPIGYVVLKGFNMDLFTAEIGIAILDNKYRNKGYGKLASKRMISYSFAELNLQTIGASILLSNQTSINMFKSLGFVEREILYKSWPMPNGELADMILMEVTNQT